MELRFLLLTCTFLLHRYISLIIFWSHFWKEITSKWFFIALILNRLISKTGSRCNYTWKFIFESSERILQIERLLLIDWNKTTEDWSHTFPLYCAFFSRHHTHKLHNHHTWLTFLSTSHLIEIMNILFDLLFELIH